MKFPIKRLAHFSSGTFLSRVSGFLRDLITAGLFGTEPMIATFFLAFRWSQLARRLFGEGAMQAAFTPLFVEFEKKDREKSARFFRDLILTLLLSLFAILGALALLLPHSSTLSLTLLLAIGTPFVCLFGVFTSFLQIQGHFFVTGFAPVIFNACWILGAILAYYLDGGMRVLAAFVVFGCILEWIFVVPSALKYLPQEVSFWKKTSLFSSDVRRLAGPLFLGILGISAVQINSALDPIFAQYADPSGPAYLWYALRIQQLPVGLFSVGFSSVLFPALAKNQETASALLKDTLKKAIFLTGIASGLLFFLAPYLIRLIYFRGAFDLISLEVTSRCLAAYAMGLVPLTVALILTPAFYTKKNYFQPNLIGFLSVLMNICLNTLFVFYWNWGAESIAWATSISALFQALSLSVLLIKKTTSSTSIPKLYDMPIS